MLNNYIIAETETFSINIVGSKYKSIYQKVKNYVYPILRKNPFFGPNIKKLKGEFADIYRFRIGKYRLFYSIDKDRVTVFIIDIKDRKNAYN